MTTVPGLIEQVYLGGTGLTLAPLRVTPSWEIAETRQRAADGTLLVHRSKLFVGCAERLRKATFSLSWPAMNGEDIDVVNDIIAFGGPFDFCAWRPITESFWIPANTPRQGTLQRRSAITVIPSQFLPVNAATLYAHHAIIDGSVVAAAFGQPDDAGHTPWTAASQSNSSQRVFFRYYPIYRVHVGEGQEDFQQPFLQTQTLVLEEV